MSKSNKTKTSLKTELKAPCLVKRSKKEIRTLTVNIELEYRTCVTNFVAEKVIKALLEDEEFTDGNIKVKKIDILS